MLDASAEVELCMAIAPCRCRMAGSHPPCDHSVAPLPHVIAPPSWVRAPESISSTAFVAGAPSGSLVLTASMAGRSKLHLAAVAVDADQLAVNDASVRSRAHVRDPGRLRRHKTYCMRNALALVPKGAQQMVAATIRTVCYTSRTQTVLELVTLTFGLP